MRALTDFDVALVGRAGQPGEVGVQHVAWQILVPFRMHQQRRHPNLSGVVQRFAGAPVLAPVLHHAVGRTQRRRRCGRTDRVGGQRRGSPGFEPARRYQIGLLVFRDSGQPALARRTHRDRTVGPQCGAVVGQRWRRTQPLRRIQNQFMDLVVVLRGVPAHRAGAPRPTQQIQLCRSATLENEIDRSADVLDRRRRANQGHICRSRLRHLRRPGRTTITAQIDQVDVVAALGNVIHPRKPVQRQIEGGLGRIGGAMHVQQDAFGRKSADACRMLVTHIQVDAGVARRHHEFFHDSGRCSLRASQQSQTAQRYSQHLQDASQYAPR